MLRARDDHRTVRAQVRERRGSDLVHVEAAGFPTANWAKFQPCDLNGYATANQTGLWENFGLMCLRKVRSDKKWHQYVCTGELGCVYTWQLIISVLRSERLAAFRFDQGCPYPTHSLTNLEFVDLQRYHA